MLWRQKHPSFTWEEFGREKESQAKAYLGKAIGFFKNRGKRGEKRGFFGMRFLAAPSKTHANEGKKKPLTQKDPAE